ncbi:baculoviral IAP repeat-containing protein 7-A-like [Amphibalanus amphitrite]|uniref:baculoviral IAP repeat-containing protein 7-A-like n=1 Tax=Amphibalanus amphitrite TaxID=1232801 RepID=UPI001C8FF855|nr:baculoviral IAP repeat-containing protein 7-A-like [Amphibalanus amphitrite]
MTSNLILSRGTAVVSMAPNRGSVHGQTRLTADPSNMRYEKNRLATFSSWPLNAPVPKERLAKAGFFYRGPPFRVECFSCGGTVDDWQFNEQAMLKHQRLYPQCPFVTHRSDNVPLLEGGGGGGSPIPAHDSGYSSSQSPPSSQGSAASTSPRSGFRFPLATGGSATPAAPGAPRSWDAFRLLKSERHRRRTFGAWPVDFISPDDLARAGFFSLNDGDKAQCIFCRGIVGGWELGDVPMTEHSRHFPQCPFVRGCEVGNVPDDGSSDSEGELDDTLRENVQLGGEDEVGYRIDYRTRSVAESSPCSRLTSSHMNVQTPLGSEQTSDLTQLGISEHQAPIHPSYATVESRLRSYQYWPPALAQKPRQLAEAGFFYAGVSDHVKCFHCDGGLRNWVPGDDPWTEHARWFSRCGFLRLVKGEDFIQDVLRHNPPQEAPPEGEQPATADTQVKRRPFSDEEVERMMEDAICKTAVELGVAREAVKRVLKERLESTGLPFTDLSSVLAMAVDHTQATYQPPTSSSAGASGVSGHARATSTLSAASTMSADSGMEDARSQDEEMEEAQSEPTTPQGSEVAMTSQLSNESSQTLTNGSSSGSNSGANTPKLLPGGGSTPVSGQSGSLEEEYIRLKEQKQCKVCMDEDVGVVFLPCGHLITCVNCAPALRDCPLCRQPIRGTVRTYLS